MKKTLLVISLLISGILPMNARRFTFGVELGAGSPVVSYHSYSYKLDMGYRVSDRQWSVPAFPVAFAYVKFGYMVTPVLETAISVGYEGISRDERAIPVMLKLSVYPSGREKGGVCFFAGGGVMIPDNLKSRVTFGGHIGGGWRFPLSSVVALEPFLRLSLNTRYPDLYDPDTELKIPSENIYLNRMFQGTVSAGFCASF